MTSPDTLKPNIQKPSDANDKSQVPDELTVQATPLSIKQVLALPDGDIIAFTYGTYIPGATAFNQYLEANVGPGDTKNMLKSAVIKMIKHLALTLNSGGLAALPMICLKEECIRWESCPVRLVGEQVPTGRGCPVEKTEVLAHVRGLSEDFGAGRTYADQIMIQGVSSVQVIKSRVMSDLSKYSAPVVKVKKGVDAQGRVVKELVENPNINLLAKLQKQEHLLLKGLHLTQEQRKKLEGHEAVTSDVVLSSLKKKLQELRRTAGTEGLEIQDAEIKVHTVDETMFEDGEDQNVDKEILRGGEQGDVSSDSGDAKSQAGLADKDKLSSLDSNASDIRECSGRVDQEIKDYRTVKPRRSEESRESYIGQSPFRGRSPGRPDANTRSDADSLEETF